MARVPPVMEMGPMGTEMGASTHITAAITAHRVSRRVSIAVLTDIEIASNCKLDFDNQYTIGGAVLSRRSFRRCVIPPNVVK